MTKSNWALRVERVDGSGVAVRGSFKGKPFAGEFANKQTLWWDLRAMLGMVGAQAQAPRVMRAVQAKF